MSQSKKFRELINSTFELSQTVDGVKTVYVSGGDVEFYVKKHFGNVYCYYDSTTDLKADFDQFNRLHINDFVRLLQALKFDYNPCENYDKYSDITVSHTGTIGITSNSTMTNKVNAFDSDSLVTDGETVGNGGNTTTLNNSDGTTEHTHGNIGVQTVSNMILQQGTGEAYLRFNNFVEHYLNRWICGCMVAYGNEENEIEFSQDVEYATKTELETLAQSTSEALNDLTNTMNEHSNSINTLDNSLGSVIEDLEDISESVEDHEEKISTLEDQLTANDLPIYLDYQGGKYGYNTSPTRGADTFTPFSSGGASIEFEPIQWANVPGYLSITGEVANTDNFSIVKISKLVNSTGSLGTNTLLGTITNLQHTPNGKVPIDLQVGGYSYPIYIASGTKNIYPYQGSFGGWSTFTNPNSNGAYIS